MRDLPDSYVPSLDAAPAGAEQAQARGLLGLLDRYLARHGIGTLAVTLPSGTRVRLGTREGGATAEVAIRSWRALWTIARRGILGFAESYMDGTLDTPDLGAVFAFYFANETAIAQAFPRVNGTRRRDRRFHRARANTREGSRRNIADHYDLGNAFYRLWLDASFFYSSGVYRSGADDLADAQREKLRIVLAGLALKQGDALLEIGCGWGTMAEAAARAGANVRAITLSTEQQHEASARVAAAGLGGDVTIALEDYRDTRGRFDKIVSIEMIEAVGEENWPAFFGTIADRLRPGGRAVLQAITIRDDIFESYRDNPDFIQRYIFPGGMLPPIGLMRQRAREAGLSFEIVERFGPSYARTLADWRHRFEAAWPEIARLGFDERFRRMWRYYLQYCEAGFERGLIDVGIYKLEKPA